jgi:adenine-specific DNA-methyltransferase
MLALKELTISRKKRISRITSSHKEKFAQYLTPVEIANVMARLSTKHWKKSDRAFILDPGAGTGILFYCLINELYKKDNILNLSLDAWEIDDTIIPELIHTCQKIKKNSFKYSIHHKDFIADISHEFPGKISNKYDIIIMNPPYKKIHSNSIYRNSMRNLGIETTNTYSAFMALAVKLLADNGILTAIVPRSFCNGLYFLPFRKFLFDNAAILHIHSFEARDNAFGDENVLQENIIIVLKKTQEKRKTITVSLSKDKLFSDYNEKRIPYSKVISPDDTQMYISIPTKTISVSQKILSCQNYDLGFDISTGPVVDFRLKDKLIFNEPNKGIPLLYSVHIRNQEINWPVLSKKPNAILLDEAELKKIAFPKGYYILIKRFSSKEEKRRIYASLLTPDSLPADYFTVENHLNIIHCKHGSLNRDIALGLTAWMNTVYCDDLFRNFSGHTQVNATDLRNMKYPASGLLIKLGQLTKDRKREEYDHIFEKLALKNAE